MWNESIKLFRQKNNLSQQTVADYLGIKQTTYGRYELGTIEPGVQTIEKLADFYKVSTDALLGRNKFSIKSSTDIKNQLSKIQTDLEDIKKMI